MAGSNIKETTTFDPNDLYLSPKEHNLLLTALNSNRSQSNRPVMMNNLSNSTGSVKKPNGTQYQLQDLSDINTSFDSYVSPNQNVPGSATLTNGFEDSPYLDYNIEDGNFDWDDSEQLIGGLPGDESFDNGDEDNEQHDKRKSPEDDLDDDEEEEGGGKRREGEDKTSKKPGRKPMTSEPTSKRKAQNRAAQRAFRERKERHLKELETKVDDLEKASESANHENGILRAQVNRLQDEVKEYRKRLTASTGGLNRSPSQTMSSKTNYDLNNNFQFEFPRFGKLSDPPALPRPTYLQRNSTGASNGQTVESPKSISAPSRSSSTQQSTTAFNNGIAELNGLFSPSVMGSVNRNNSSDYIGFNGRKSNANSSSRVNTINSSVANQQHKKSNGTSEYNTASPSASSISHGLVSSSGTSPEPSADSPGQFKSTDAMLTFPSADDNNKVTDPFQSIDWMAQQNGGNFDPVLFGDYRDPQENIMNSGLGDFFGDAFTVPTDLYSPSNQNVTPFPAQFTNTMLEPTLPSKKDLIKEIEDHTHMSGEKPDPSLLDRPKQFLTCNMLWDRVQRSDKVQSGEADMDDLCTQLKAKARCSGSGAVIDQSDVDAILGPAPSDQHDFLKMFR
ncbi:DNA-binding transcription factor yap1 [Agyrium rufum]|nr:DNA-binding transcription factor yap1 [Agyrium rufum]